MKLKQALFNEPGVSIYQVDTASDDYFYSDDFLNWDVEPIEAEILTAEYVRGGMLEGYFILKATFIPVEGEVQPCYVDVSMPERISERIYFKSDDEIIEENRYGFRGKAIPLVAIDGFGNYNLFYSKRNPEIGLNVLRYGLNLAKRKAYIAQDMAYILRDEKRYQEAVEAFSMLIAEGANDVYPYLERAALLEKLGDVAGAAKDRELSELRMRERGRNK